MLDGLTIIPSSQAQPNCVDNIDAHGWITGWKDIQNLLKGFQRHTILFNPTNNLALNFTILQMSVCHLYNPTNDLALNFTILQIIWILASQGLAVSIYMKYVNQKQHMNLTVYKPTLLNFFLNWELQLQILRACTTGTFCFQMYKTMVIHCWA